MVDDDVTEFSPVTFDNCVLVCSPSTADTSAETIVESQVPSQGNGATLPQQPTERTVSTPTTETIVRYPRRNRKPHEWFEAGTSNQVNYSGLLYIMFIVHVCIHFLLLFVISVISMC